MIEVLKQALKAFEVATTPLAKDRQEVLEAVAAINQAIAELESQEPMAWQLLGSAHFRKKIPKNADITAWNPLYHYPPKLEQKIVAWGVFEGNLHDMFFTQEEAQEMAKLKGSHAEVRPLYTHPPKRTWAGLTDDEIEEGIKQSWVTEQAFQSAAWWAEAKLKEKNNV
jgi:hypothetical protein